MASVQVRFRVEFDPDAAVGPGKIALLEHIDLTGSLSQAARELQMSYRRAWLLLESLNVSFKEPAVTTSTGGRGGGGARLTPFGRELVATYRRFERDTQERAEQHFRGLFAQLPRSSHTKRRPALRSRLSKRPG